MPCILMIERDWFYFYLALAIANTLLVGIIIGANVYKASLENGSKAVVPYMYDDSGQPIKWKVVDADQQ